MIQEQARMYSQELNKLDFKASNGWLTRLKVTGYREGRGFVD